jgi:anti-sigma regulatory factor (Ser/Thr protein kinase)
MTPSSRQGTGNTVTAKPRRLPLEGAMAPAPPWPLQTQLELAALRTAPGDVRSLVRLVAGEWGLADLADTAELLASELVTNAVQASVRPETVGSQVIRIWLTSDGATLVIHVWDFNPEMPVPQEAAPDAEGGRGLMLVGALGKDWGAYRAKEGGKIVWVMIADEALPDAADE